MQAYSYRYSTWEVCAFSHTDCTRLISADENGPGAIELNAPEYIDPKMDGAFGHAAHCRCRFGDRYAMPAIERRASCSVNVREMTQTPHGSIASS